MTGSPDPTPTVRLLARFKQGDPEALELLFARYVPDLRKWARGRLPQWARDIADTDDLVQETALQTFRNLNGFEDRGDDALVAYLRRALMNRVRDEFRRKARRPEVGPLDSGMIDDGTSPIDAAIGAQAAGTYEAALGRLSRDERDAIIARVELGLTYPEMAEALKKPSPDAARMAAARALVRLAEEMGRADPTGGRG
ncbi:MAG TPA: sigma-70 family RNA polymerase sigma factor [Vicinamibacterales bacterium]|nr:sigma-70 family RNA polymerase sigma factor [Vicinamibacterales bacterium]